VCFNRHIRGLVRYDGKRDSGDVFSGLITSILCNIVVIYVDRINFLD
jgi:hypothetical protein